MLYYNSRKDLFKIIELYEKKHKTINSYSNFYIFFPGRGKIIKGNHSN
jgi:hypothetical protein